MIVCLCNGLNESKVIKSVRHMLNTNASEEMIYHMMEFQCGKCMSTVKEIIDDLKHLEKI
jgi:bacterioferritin-associated ferredoxin